MSTAIRYYNTVVAEDPTPSAASWYIDNNYDGNIVNIVSDTETDAEGREWTNIRVNRIGTPQNDNPTPVGAVPGVAASEAQAAQAQGTLAFPKQPPPPKQIGWWRRLRIRLYQHREYQKRLPFSLRMKWLVIRYGLIFPAMGFYPAWFLRFFKNQLFDVRIVPLGPRELQFNGYSVGVDATFRRRRWGKKTTEKYLVRSPHYHETDICASELHRMHYELLDERDNLSWNGYRRDPTFMTPINKFTPVKIRLLSPIRCDVKLDCSIIVYSRNWRCRVSDIRFGVGLGLSREITVLMPNQSLA